MKIANKETIRRLIEDVFNRGNLSLANEIIHPDYRYTSPTESMKGIDELKAFIVALRSAFPDLRIEVVDQLADEEKVCTRLLMTGTHRGDFFGVPATGNSIEVEGVVISQLQEGMVYREWELLDQFSLFQQLERVSASA